MARNKPVDGLERGVRFGCGALLGALVGFYIVAEQGLVAAPGETYLAAAVVGAVVCGLLAMAFGDRFWQTGVPTVLGEYRWPWLLILASILYLLWSLSS